MKMQNGQTARQQEIVDCARRIITSKGVENLTIAELAKELKLTQGAIYRHFKSKKEIVDLLIDDIEKTLLEAVEQAVNVSDKPLEKLEGIFSAHLSYASQRKGVSFIVINETLSLKDKSLQKKMLGAIHKYLDKISGILLEGQKSGLFRKSINTTAGSIAFFGMVQSMVTVWALNGFKHSLNNKNRMQELFEIYKEGVISK